jgi:hypothetical protein
MNKNMTQMIVAVLGIAGLVTATVIALITDSLHDERQILIGGLIAATSTAAAWLFRMNGTVK